MSAAPKLPTPEEIDERVEACRVDPRTLATTREKMAYANAISFLIDSAAASEWPRRSAAPEAPVVAPFPQGLPTMRFIAEQARKERPKRSLIVTSMDDVQEEDVQWLWPGRLPLGALSTVMGRMGNGKSTFRDWLAATVSAGHPWPDSPEPNEPGTVLILQAEEHKGRIVKHRMNAFAYGRGRVLMVDGVNVGDGTKSWFSMALDCELLAEKCSALGDVRMIIVDPIGAYLKGVKNNSDTEVRDCLQPLKDLAEEQDLSVVIIAHPNKDQEKEVINRLSGSAAFGQLVRSLWYLSADPRDKSRKLLSLMKENTPGTTKTAIAVHYDDRKKVITWFPEAVNLSADQVDNMLQREAREEKLRAKTGRPVEQGKAAEEFVLKALATGPASLSVLRENAMLLGVSFSTLRRAIKALTSDARKAIERYEVDANGETRIWFRLAENGARE